MGYRLETYKLSELNKISGGGGAVPALFWWLPIGRWPEGQLWEVWSHFVRDRDSLCHQVGLALIKGPEQGKDERAQDISALTGQLSELVPEGSSFGGYDGRTQDQGHFLLLSGAYPQPGWGLLVSGQGAMSNLEDLVTEALSRAGAQGTSAVQPIVTAAAAYHELEAVKRKIVSTLERDALDQENIRLSELGGSLRELASHLDNRSHDGLGGARVSLKERASELSGLSLMDDREYNALKLDHQLAQVTVKEERQRISEILDGFQSMRESGKEIKPKLITESGIGPVAKPWLKAGDIAPAINVLFDHVESRYQERFSRMQKEVHAALQCVQADLGKVQLEREEANRQIEETRRSNATEHLLAGVRFRSALIAAVKVQTELGTRFLVEFESVCLARRIPCTNIAWDPARMVGWKLWARGADLRLEDLYDSARELAPDLDGFNRIGDPGNLSNGSLFTDYVHHIAYSDLKRTPRDITVAVVEKLRGSERRQIMARQGGGEDQNNQQPVSADELVSALGWPLERTTTKVPMAAAINALDNKLRDNIDGNDLRIILESYCKDVIDLVSNELGFSDRDLYDTVQRAVPSYRTNRDNWSEEVGQITTGAAALVLEALLPLAFPGADENTRALLGGIRTLSALLNTESHDREENKVASFPRERAAVLVQQLLEQSHELMGELPWHFKAMQTTGRQPRVLTGTAWSHSHPEQRSLRVMLWNGENIDQEALIWNRERINPIITDPRIIRRPGRN